MQVTLSTRDLAIPALLALTDAVKSRETMEAAALAVVSLARRAFREPGLRPAAWPARGPGQGDHQLLRKSGTLWRSIRVAEVSATSATIASDRVYAAIHQFGGTIRGNPLLTFKIGNRWVRKASITIPARPYMPLTAGGELTERGKDAVRAAIAAKLTPR